MKKIFLVGIVLFTSVLDLFSQIVYNFPPAVNEKIKEHLDKEDDLKNIYFILGSDACGNYKITITTKNYASEKFYVSYTNREVYLNGQFYPLIFETDVKFSYSISKYEFEQRIKTGVFPKELIIIEYPIEIVFNSDGDIIIEECRSPKKSDSLKD